MFRWKACAVCWKMRDTAMNEICLYPYSAKEAKRRAELPLWRESHQTNIFCRNAIESTIRQNFDGMHLNPDCLDPVLAEFGYHRTAWVLANTLRELHWDGRFSHANKLWAERITIPEDGDHNAEFIVRSHPAVLDGFIDLYREAEQNMEIAESEEPKFHGMTMN